MKSSFFTEHTSNPDDWKVVDIPICKNMDFFSPITLLLQHLKSQSHMFLWAYKNHWRFGGVWRCLFCWFGLFPPTPPSSQIAQVSECLLLPSLYPQLVCSHRGQVLSVPGNQTGDPRRHPSLFLPNKEETHLWKHICCKNDVIHQSTISTA